MSKNLKVAVVTGVHPYDVVNFQEMFRSFSGIRAYPQNMEDLVTDTGAGIDFYDVVLFYHMITQTPGTKENRFNQSMEKVLTRLGNKEQGIVVLHHAVVGFPEWETWDEICGLDNRINEEVEEGVEINFNVENDSHYITSGLGSWSMEDEFYTIPEADNNPENEILITTDHPRSTKTIAWTRNYKNSRVFCYSSGHDNHAFSHENFKKVVKRGIEWSAGVSN